MKITVSAADYLTLNADPTTLKVGDNSAATVRFYGDGSIVTSSSTIKAYTTESGTTESSIVSISGGTVTGNSVGECYLEATYSTGGKTYKSNRVKITVSADPITIIWASDSQPTYVAQRGKVSVGGLQSGETITSVEPTTSGVVRTVTSSGGTFYVECLRAGSYTLRVTTSKGRTADLPGTVYAPTLVLSQATLYANPDGTVAHTGTDGLTGNTLRVTYETTGAGGTPVGATFSVVTTDVAIGGKLHQGLFSELLEPQPSSTASILTFDVGSVNSSGITALDTYANDVYEYSGANGSSAPALATVTVAPKEISTGVDQKTFTVKEVNPFVNWAASATTQPDEDDYGIVSQYVSHTYTARSVSLYETLAGSRTSGGFTVLNSGIEVFFNDATAPSALSGVFSLGSSNTVSYTLSESALSDHKGGLVEIKGYVENMHSMNRIYHAGAEFGIYVHGAIGAVMSGIGTSNVLIGTDWCGDEASYGFGMIGDAKFISTDYTNGTPFNYVASDAYLSDISESAVSFGETVYGIRRPSGTIDDPQRIRQAEKPRFKFEENSIGVRRDTGIDSYFYYLQPNGTPSNGTHGYYVLHLLGDIQNKGTMMGSKQGWLN